MLRVLIHEDRCDPRYNLAIDESLLITHYLGITKGSTLRIWRNLNSVVLGYFSRLEDEVNIRYLRRLNPIVVRRFTGGGSVYHDLGNLNYTIVTELPSNSRPIDYIYKYLLKGLIGVLKELSLNVEVVNLSDVLVNDRKVSGNAGTFKNNYALLHGTLLISTDASLINELFKVPWDRVRKYGIDPRKYRVTNLRRVLGRYVSEYLIRELIIKNYSSLLRDTYVITNRLSSEESEIANILYNLKYSRDSWNLSRVYDRGLISELIRCTYRR